MQHLKRATQPHLHRPRAQREARGQCPTWDSRRQGARSLEP